MKKYNRALDFMALAVAALLNGEPTKASKALIKASRMPDAPQAIAIIEASNAQAHAVEASAKVVKTPASAKSVQAAKRLKAAEFDLGDDVDSVLDDDSDMGAPMEDTDMGEDTDEGMDELGDEDTTQPDFNDEFASVLASMKKKASK